jgi:hypothetical protein
VGVLKVDTETTVWVGATLGVTLLVVDIDTLALLEEASDSVPSAVGEVDEEKRVEDETVMDCCPLPVPPPKSSGVKEGCPLEVWVIEEVMEGEVEREEEEVKEPRPVLVTTADGLWVNVTVEELQGESDPRGV